MHSITEDFDGQAAELWLELVHEFACHCEVIFDIKASWAKSVGDPPTD